MAYLVEDLLGIFRTEVEDTVQEYFWSDQEFFWYLDEAQKEFARLTDYFKDSSTPAVTQPAITIDSPWIDIDPRIIEIRRARLGSRSRPLRIVNFNELDKEYTTGGYGEQLSGNWDTAKGTPRLLVTDEQTNKARLVPIPSASDTIQFSVIRLPVNDIVDDGSVLELAESAHQRSLLMFCKAMAYEKQDSDSGNMQLADRYKMQFYQYCKIVKGRQTRKQRRVGTVKYGGL